MHPPSKLDDSARRPSHGLERYAWWLDSAIAVPGTRFRIGLDALLGLIPGVGDLAGTALSSYIILVAAREGAPPAALLRMTLNVAIEGLVGAVPLIGDLFDAAWRANERNVKLLRQYHGAPQAARRQSKLVIAIWVAVLLAALAGIGALAFAVIRWLLATLSAS